MSTEAQKILAIARAQKGYHEAFKNGHWNNDQRFSDETPGLEWSDFQAWCATFVAWCAMKAGLADLYPRTPSCAVGVDFYKKRGRFSTFPAIGAQVFFGKNGGTHTGLVYDYDDEFIYTIEGNTNAGTGSPEGDGVYEMKHRRKETYVFGYGYPDFAEGIKSADPAYKAEAPKVPSKAKPKSPAPKVDAPKTASRIIALAPEVRPGATHAQVRELQQLLIKAGYGPIPGAPTNFYGPETQRAVARFHDRNPAYRSGLHDPRIGPKGFVALQKKAGRR